MESISTNTVVIGGGPGGYAAAIRLGQLGIQTILIEKKEVGGTCLNVGCIPSKALLHASSYFSSLGSEGTNMGISSSPKIDWNKTIQWKDGIVKKLTGGVRTLLKQNKVQLIEGVGKISEPGVVNVEGDKPAKISCENIILATGSSTIELPPFPVDQKQVLDSTGLLALEKVPKSMVILGGGIIGMELGTVYASLGCKVTVLEMMDRILAMYEADATKIVQRSFEKLGGTVLTKVKALACETSSKGVKVVYEDLSSQEQKSLDVDILAVAIGRKPNFQGVDLEKLNIELDKGRIPVDDQLQTKAPGVYAIGDLISGPMLAHKATAEGVMTAEAIAGKAVSLDDIQIIPDVVYTKPEIAQAGVSEAEAKEKGIEITIGKFPLAALGRAATTNESVGYIKYIANRITKRIIGATIVSYKASELISEATLAIEMAATLEDVGHTVHPHPSFGEGHMEAALAGLKEAIHIVN